MNKACILLIGSFILASDVHTIMPGAQKGSVNNFTASAQLTNNERGPYPVSSYKYPEFYRGLYLTVASANNFAKLKYFVEKAKSSNINTLVLDVQSSRNVQCMVPEPHVRHCTENGIHPVARIVVFPDGLRRYPVPESYL